MGNCEEMTTLQNTFRTVLMATIAILYLAGDIMIYKFSGLSFRDALTLDVPITIICIIIAWVCYAATGGDDESV